MKIPLRRKRRWTKKEDAEMLRLLEKWPASEVAKRLQRTRLAVECRVRDLGFKLQQGKFSLTGLCEETGYTQAQIKRAAQSLGQKWRRERRGTRTHRRGKPVRRWTARTDGKGGPRWLITEDQITEILEWLRNPPPTPERPRRWSRKFDCCVVCRTTELQHYSRGRCSHCYRVEQWQAEKARRNHGSQEAASPRRVDQDPVARF